MSDVKVVFGGPKKVVSRTLVQEGGLLQTSDFWSHECVKVVRLIDNEVLHSIYPGMAAYAVREDMDLAPTFADAMAKPEALEMVLISEIISATGPKGLDESDDARVRGLRLKPVQRVVAETGIIWENNVNAGAGEFDLAMGDQPFYFSMQALLAPAPVVVGRRAIGTADRRRISCFIGNADDQLKAGNDVAITVEPLFIGHLALKPVDAEYFTTAFLMPEELCVSSPEVSMPPLVALLPAPSVEVDVKSSKKKRGFSAISSALFGDDIESIDANWKSHKEELAQFVRERMRDVSAEESLVREDAEVQSAFAFAADNHLSGEFGEFIDETAHEDDEALVDFAVRFAPPLDKFAHAVYLRPAAYMHLKTLTFSKNFGQLKPLSADVRAKLFARRVQLAKQTKPSK